MPTRSQLLHFDSLYATYLQESNSSTGNTPIPCRAMFPMNQSFRRIKRVYLKSIEIPVGFCNVRTGSTATLSMLVNGTTYTVTLAEKTYTAIATLIADINTAVASATVASGATIVFGLTGSTTTPSRLQILVGGAASFSIVDTNLSKYILGFRAARDSLAAGVYAASASNYNLNPDNYFLLHIPSLNGMKSSMMAPLQSTFKIPLNSISNQVYDYFESSSFQQFVEIHDPNLMLSTVVVYVVDRFGNTLSPNGLDYSFTLGIDYEV